MTLASGSDNKAGKNADARQTRVDTRTALIIAAERIFSEEGIANTSLRRITQAAGQRNESAIHYHFGSREGVVEAILNMRTEPINRIRVDMLAQAQKEAGDQPLSSHKLAETLTRPLADYLRASGGSSHYLRFLGMFWLDQTMWRKFAGRSRDEGLILVRDALLEAKPHLPPIIVRHRYACAIQMSTHTLARLERMAGNYGPSWDWMRADVEISDLIDANAAIFDAPVSPATVQALRAYGALPGS